MAYDVFAKYYDDLTTNVNYSELSDYILKIFAYFNHKPGIVLDLACGTGSLTIELAKRNIDIYGVDGSPEMLSEAQMKAYENNLNILFLKQRMECLDLYGTINTCLCCLDSINHITDKNVLQKAFSKVSLFMEKDGLFIFDCNTIYKHKNILADNVYVFDNNLVYCVWQNKFIEKNNLVEISLDFFEENQEGKYSRYSESFSEKAYSLEELTEMLTNVDFKIIGVFDERTFDPVKENSERMFIVARKK